MPGILRTPGSLLRYRHEDGSWGFSRCRQRCCTSAFYYLAVRCDIRYRPPVPLPIPEEVPTHILIPGPWGCPGDTCEIEGERLVLYGGYCYVVSPAGAGEYQEPPCDDRPLAMRIAESERPQGVPVVLHAQLTCKPRGDTCNEDCIPIAEPGSCCSPQNCSNDPGRNECYPCDCPTFKRFGLVMQWSARYTTRGPGACLPEFDVRNSGSTTAIYDCDELPGLLVSLNGTVTRSCEAGPGMPDWCPLVEYSGPPQQPDGYGSLRFGDVPAFLAMVETRYLDASGAISCNAGYETIVPSVTAPPTGRPCVGGETRDDSCQSGDSWALSSNCYGGTYSASGTGASNAEPGCTRFTYTTSIAWAWVPLVRCADAPDPLLDVPPAVKDQVRRALRKLQEPSRLTFRDVARMIIRGEP